MFTDVNYSGLSDADIKKTVGQLQSTFSSESKQIRDLTLEVKNMKRISKTFPVFNASDSTIGAVRHRLLEIDKILPSLCFVTEELSMLKQLCHHGDEVTPDPEKMFPESYGFLLDLMTKYEENCRQKEQLENLINKVRIHLMRTPTCPILPTLDHSTSSDLEISENYPPSKHLWLDGQRSIDSASTLNSNTMTNSSMQNRRTSVDSEPHFNISLFPEFSKETLHIAQSEYHKRRPLQPFSQNKEHATLAQTSNAVSCRVSKSPLKCQSGSCFQDEVHDWPSSKLWQTPTGVRQSFEQGHQHELPMYTSCAGPVRVARSPVKCQAGVYGVSGNDVTGLNPRPGLSSSLRRVRSPMLNNFLKKGQNSG